jgi:lipocalin-like protein
VLATMSHLRIGLLAFVLIFSQTSGAADTSIVGNWQLLSMTAEDPETGAVTKPWGEHPTGSLTYTPGGRMSAILTSQSRRPASGSAASPTEEGAWAYWTSAAYAGTYSLNADSVVHHVEVAANPAWVGTDQVRALKLEGALLTLKTPPLAGLPDGKKRIFTLVWKRVE